MDDTICHKCKNSFKELEEHHLWPKFMDNPHGKSFNGFISRFDLCREHHLELHKQIIMPLLQKFSERKKFSEHSLWKSIDIKLRPTCIEEIVYTTLSWLDGEK